MKEVESENDIVDERVELMASPLGRSPCLRSARFLKPCSYCSNNPSSLIPNTIFSESACFKPFPPSTAEPSGYLPLEQWKCWEKRLRSKYQDVWRDASILEAIKASTFQIEWSNDLVFGLAQKWRSETNTFIFSWGEATVTLEDIMVCGGYPVVGSSIFTPLEDEESKQLKKKLVEIRKNLPGLLQSRCLEYFHWLRHFGMEKGELEHAAFLSLWLARFVFSSVISNRIFRIALHLARGTTIALAPAVLAGVYGDLTLLKSINKDVKLKTKEGPHMVNLKNKGSPHIPITVTAPLQLVQIWALERFPSLHPNLNITRNFQPMIAKWHKVKMSNYYDVCLALDSSAETFLWRPYKDCPKFYNEKDKWVCFNSHSHMDLESFARCIMHYELVGIHYCREKYLPYRVAMQFGLDQDIPGWVAPCSNKICPMADWIWRKYHSPMTNSLLSAVAVASPSTLEPSVTSRYLEWWKRSKLGWGEDTHMDSMPISTSENLLHASSNVGSHSHGHRDQTGGSNENDDSTVKEHNKRYHSHENDVSAAHGVENLAKSDTMKVFRRSKRAKADKKHVDVNGMSKEAKQVKYANNGKEGEDIIGSTCTEPVSKSKKFPQASSQLRSSDADDKGDSHGKTDSVAPSQDAADNTYVSFAVEKLATSENTNAVGGSKRAMDDTGSEYLIGKCGRAREEQNDDNGEGSYPCAEDTELSDCEKLEQWLLSWANRNSG